MKNFIILFLFAWFALPCFAQDEEITVNGNEKEFQLFEKELRNMYNNGQLEELIVDFKKKCLTDKGIENKKFKRIDKDTKADIYNIISYAFIATDRADSASPYLKRMYEIKHAKDFSDDWMAVKKDREKYYVLPHFMLGVNFGTVFTSALLSKRNYLFENTMLRTSDPMYANRNQIYDKQYSQLLSQHSYSVGLSLDYRVFRDLILSFSPSYVTRKFSVSSNYSWDKGFMFGDRYAQDTLRSATYNVSHVYTNNYFEFPIDVKYIYSKWRVRPYISVGYGYSILNGAQVVENTVKNIVNSDGTPLSYSSSQTLQMTDYFKNFHVFRGALGANYSLGGLFDLSFKVLYERNISPILNVNNLYSNATLIWSSYYAMDEFNLQSLRFEFSIVAPLTYKAFKKK